MKKYAYQKFLLNCDYEKVKMEDIPWFIGNIDEIIDYREGYCLFDLNHAITRKIDISYLDEYVDTEDDWKIVLDMLRDVEIIIVYNSDVSYSNPIIQKYREATIKAYFYRLMQLKKKIYRI